MNRIVVSLAWCWVQTLVVAGAAIGLSMLATRRSPAAGAAIAWVGVLAALALMLLAPIPAPRWATSEIQQVKSSLVAADQPAAKATFPTDASNDFDAGRAMNLKAIGRIVASVEQSQTAVASHIEIGRVIVGIVGAGILLGLARIGYGLWAIAILCRKSRVIVEEQLAAVIHELRPKLGLRQLPQVRESDGLFSAAVIGWWRPMILLPSGWREWSAAELKAVMAHELAHVCRRDFALRLVAVFTSALQCGQPLVVWLRWQLTLAQELAADELAAAAIGSRAEYLQAITRLALKQDRRCIDGSVAALLPVFSGFLLRRIAMLRAKDGRASRGLRQPLQWSAMGIVIFAAIATTAIRGLAEPPDREADGSVRVATARAVKPKPPATGADAHAAAVVLFQRPAFDLSAVAGKNGGFLVRLGEILKRTGFVEQAGALDQSFAAFWKDAFPDAELPTWSFRDIDYVAGDFYFAVKPAKNPTEKYSNQVMFGAPSVIVRWSKPLNRQFEWLRRTPGATEKLHEGIAYVELPIIPALGPTKGCVCQLDDRTLFVAQSEALFLSRLSTLQGPHELKAWEKEWHDVDGGLVTLVSTDANFVRPLADPVDEEAKLYHDLFGYSRLHAIGVDWQEGAEGVTVVKAQFRFDTAEDAERWKNAIRTATKRAVDMVNAEDAKDDKKTEKAEQAEKQAKVLLEALQQAKIETRQSDEGWIVEMQLAGPLDYRPLWEP
jgi:beta-lactamase regulating signal transducer with metallopeptidase domain